MKLMNTILHGMIGKTASVFLNDILVVSETPEDNFKKLDLVFSRLATAGLQVKLENVTSSRTKSFTSDIRLTAMVLKQ